MLLRAGLGGYFAAGVGKSPKAKVAQNECPQGLCGAYSQLSVEFIRIHVECIVKRPSPPSFCVVWWVCYSESLKATLSAVVSFGMVGRLFLRGDGKRAGRAEVAPMGLLRECSRRFLRYLSRRPLYIAKVRRGSAGSARNCR